VVLTDIRKQQEAVIIIKRRRKRRGREWGAASVYWHAMIIMTVTRSWYTTIAGATITSITSYPHLMATPAAMSPFP